jgi:hypothetical protein
LLFTLALLFKDLEESGEFKSADKTCAFSNFYALLTVESSLRFLRKCLLESFDSFDTFESEAGNKIYGSTKELASYCYVSKPL